MVGVTDRAPDSVERVRQALELRSSGATFQEIADECGYHSKQAAHAAVKRGLRDLQTDGVRELRVIQTLQLEELLRSVWANAIDPEAERPDQPGVPQSPKEHLAHVQVARALTKDLIDLHGLAEDAPVDELLEENTIILGGSREKYVERIKWMRAAGLTGDDMEALCRGESLESVLAGHQEVDPEVDDTC